MCDFCKSGVEQRRGCDVHAFILDAWAISPPFCKGDYVPTETLSYMLHIYVLDVSENLNLKIIKICRCNTMASPLPVHVLKWWMG